MAKKLVLILMILTGFLCACSPQGEDGALTGKLDPQNPVIISRWHYYVGDNQLALETAMR